MGGPVVIFCRFTGLKILLLPSRTVEPNVLPPSLTHCLFFINLFTITRRMGAHTDEKDYFSATLSFEIAGVK